MNYRIKDLHVEDEAFYYLSQESGLTEKSREIRLLSKLNIFVAANNSGKSRLIRSILKVPSLSFQSNGLNIEKINEIVGNMKAKMLSFLNNNRLHPNDINAIIDKIPTLEIYRENESLLLDSINNLGSSIQNLLNQGNTSQGGFTFSNIGQELANTMKEHMGEQSIKNLEEIKKLKFKRIYIPILRGLRALSGEKNDLYKNRTMSDYFNEDNINKEFEVITGMGFYDQVKGLLLGNLSERTVISDFEKFLSNNFFDRELITIIPKEESQTLVVKIGEEAERPIHDLGDGIQSIIINMLPLFIHKGEYLLVFMEEPEQWLHPGFQRKMINTMSNETGFENFQFFITTHSNHLLDISIDFEKISVYSINKELSNDDSLEKVPKFVIKNLSSGDGNLLDLLGVRNTSVFLTNCTIWVEGITDRYYLRKYLDLYKKYISKTDSTANNFKEDTNYSFVEYSGSNITHWFTLNVKDKLNAERLCGRLFLISDNDGEAKAERHRKLKNLLSSRFYQLKRREIENLLSKKVLKQVVAEYENINAESLYNNFTEGDYKNAPLGKFIEEKILRGRRRRGGRYSETSGTVAQKIDFSEKAIAYIKDWSDLSDDAQHLTKKIYKFIKKHN